MINNQTPLRQSIQEHVMDRTDRLKLQPDTGVGVISHHFYRGGTGSINAETESFWDGIKDYFADILSHFFSTDGLHDDDIYLDVTVRTPTGNKLIPNLRLNTNNFSSKVSDIKKQLKEGHELWVKIVYDGGKANEVTPVSWIFDHPGISKIAGEANLTGGKQATASDTTNVLSNLYAPGTSQPTYLTQENMIGQYQSFINQASANFSVDANLVAAVIANESSGSKTIVSSAGAIGLMQLMPDTFKGLYQGLIGSYPGLVNDATNPQTNIFCGTKFLSNLLKEFGGNLDSALSGYNAGPGATETAVRNGYKVAQYSDTIKYVASVKASYSANTSRSIKLGMTKLQQRPEVNSIEKTNASANSGQMLGSG